MNDKQDSPSVNENGIKNFIEHNIRNIVSFNYDEHFKLLNEAYKGGIPTNIFRETVNGFVAKGLFKLEGNVYKANANHSKIETKNPTPSNKSDSDEPPEFTDKQIGKGVIAIIDDLRDQLEKSDKALIKFKEIETHLVNEINKGLSKNHELSKEVESLKDEVETFRAANSSIILADKELEKQIINLKQEISKLQEFSKKDSGQLTMRLRPL